MLIGARSNSHRSQTLHTQILHAMDQLCTAPKRRAAVAVTLAAMISPVIVERALAAGPDDEIRIGNTMPYTGPASAYGVIAKVIAAYLDKVNAEGGINGRKVNLIPMTTHTTHTKPWR